MMDFLKNIAIFSKSKLHSRLLFSSFLLINSHVNWAQISPTIISPYSKNSSVTKSRGEEVDSDQPFFFPFRGAQELQDVYDSDMFNSTKITNFNLPSGSGASKARSLFVELASFIPNSSLMRMSLGTQLVQSDISDSTSEEQYRKTAISKLVNGGGNIILSLSRILIYKEIASDGFFYLNPSFVSYFDVPSLNTKNWSDRAGAQFRADFELRLLGIGTDRQSGNLIRAGIKGFFIKNLFGVRYNNTEANILNTFSERNYSGISAGAYISFALFELTYLYNYGISSDIFKGQNGMFNISIVPVKF